MFALSDGVIDLGGLGGASSARRLELVGTGIYAAKRLTDNPPYTLVNEVVCAELALMFDLPMPAYRTIEFQGETWFGLEFRVDHQDYKPEMQSLIVNSASLPHLLAFDVLICNGDRHRQNLVFQKVSPAVERYRYQVIDHSHALVGTKSSVSEFTGSIQAPSAYLQHWPEFKAMVTSEADFEGFLGMAEVISTADVDSAVAAVPSVWRPTPDDCSKLTNLLVQRARQIRTLMKQAQSCFPNWK